MPGGAIVAKLREQLSMEKAVEYYTHDSEDTIVLNDSQDSKFVLFSKMNNAGLEIDLNEGKAFQILERDSKYEKEILIEDKEHKKQKLFKLARWLGDEETPSSFTLLIEIGKNEYIGYTYSDPPKKVEDDSEEKDSDIFGRLVQFRLKGLRPLEERKKKELKESIFEEFKKTRGDIGRTEETLAAALMGITKEEEIVFYAEKLIFEAYYTLTSDNRSESIQIATRLPGVVCIKSGKLSSNGEVFAMTMPTLLPIIGLRGSKRGRIEDVRAVLLTPFTSTSKDDGVYG